MNAARVRVAALCVAWLATGCNPVAQTAAYTSPSLSKQGLDAIASLISETGAASADEAEVRDLLRRSSAVAFPARVGILFFNYTPPLPEDERQRLLARLGEEVVASGLARGAVAVPDELGRGVTLEGLRKLAARLQLDVLVLVSGSSEFKRSETQPGGLFAAFSNAANFEARSALTGFTLDVFAGTLLTPITGLGATSPTLLDPTAEAFLTASRQLQVDAFTTAANQLRDALIGSLRQVREQQAEAPTTPAPRPEPSPAEAPSPTASPTPSGTR